MLPIEHFLLAAIPICAYVYLHDRHISLRLLAVVFVGSQFPDLIDKPLAHMFHLIPTGRVFAHSLPIAIPIWIVVLAYGWWTDRIRLSAAFVVAYLSHLLGDNYRALLPPNSHIPSDLLWPFRPPIPARKSHTGRGRSRSISIFGQVFRSSSSRSQRIICSSISEHSSRNRRQSNCRGRGNHSHDESLVSEANEDSRENSRGGEQTQGFVYVDCVIQTNLKVAKPITLARRTISGSAIPSRFAHVPN